jgi:hypothetical protein
MGDWLKILATTSTVDQQFPFTGTAETLGKPTFEGDEGRKFWLET